jgi:hypothetical protein
MKKLTCNVLQLLLGHVLLLLGCLPVPFGDGLVEELVDTVDHVSPHQSETSEAATVHHTNCQGRTIYFLLVKITMVYFKVMKIQFI